MAILLLALLSQAQADFQRSLIYGDDDRLEFYQVSDQYQTLARSTVALFEGYQLEYLPSEGKFFIPDVTHKRALERKAKGKPVCASERFIDQYDSAMCSGAIVGPDLILTAGHCITDEQSCASTQIVLDYAVKSELDISGPRSFSPEQVFDCKEIVARQFELHGTDYSLVRISRPVTDRLPLAVSRERRIQAGTPLVLMGHPTGLPLKIAAGAVVRSDKNGLFDRDRMFSKGYFVANTDSYASNSGSPVFDANSGLIVGVLVRGGVDYEASSSTGVVEDLCFGSRKCANGGCGGEEVTKARTFERYIPKI